MRKLLFLNLFLTSWLCAASQDYYGDIEALYWKPSHAPIIAGRQIGPSGGGLRFRENLIIKGDHEGEEGLLWRALPKDPLILGSRYTPNIQLKAIA